MYICVYIYPKALRAHSATVPFRFLACLEQRQSQKSEIILGGCVADEQNCQLCLCRRTRDPSLSWRRMDITTNGTPSRVKGQKMNAKAPKRDLLAHPFPQFWTSLAILGCVWSALRAKGVISENLFEKGVSTESVLELVFH